MFKNRRRAVSGPPQKTTPSPNAALAASQAFLKSRASNGDLSSAAAAAALRSHSTTLVPVASVQTKRMQRKGSTASGASGGAASPLGVRRQPSSGSMIPALPQNLETHTRNKSAASPPTKVLAPTPRTPGRRRIRLDEGPDADGASSVSHSPEAQVSRRSSINFSRPISPRPSPPSSPPPARKGHSGWFTGPIVNDVKLQGNVRRTSSVPSLAPGGIYNPRHNPENSSGLKAKSSREMRNSGENMPGNVVSSHMQGPARSKTPPRKPTVDLPPTPQSSSSASDLSAESDVSSPQSRQAMRFVRKPSTVEESPEAEYAEEGDPEASRVRSESSRYMPSAEVKRTRAASQPVPFTGPRVDSMTLQPVTRYSHDRNASISPARSAHFAVNAVDVSSGFRHQPPPRSISPIKSALKHSPSSSIRTSSPKGHGKPSSDAGSDSGSLDLQRSRQLKKCTRVSFEDNRAIREDDASISSSNSLDHGSSRWGGQSAQGMDNVSENVMRPRPTLPSFGNVRRGRRDGDEELAEKATEYVPSSMSSSHTMVDPHDDRDMKSHEYASQTGKIYQSLPPEMRTAEGPDYASDDASTVESPDSENFNAFTKGYSDGKLEPTTRKLETLVETPMDVPQIAVQPATPGTEREEEAFEMPGSWSEDEQPGSPQDDHEPLSRSNLQKFRDQNTTDQRIFEDESSEEESIYSDAAEDLSQPEGGFASLDAIVQGPALSSLNAAVASRARDEKPLQSEEPKRKPDNRENEAKQQRKEGVDTANTPATTDLSAETLPRGVSQRKKKAKVVPQPLVVAPRKAAHNSSVPRAANGQPKKPALKSTMRVEKPQPPQRTPSSAKMRTTMRNSMRGPGPSGGLGASRYANVDLPEPRSALQKKKIPMGIYVSTGRPHNSMPPLTRSRSNDSDVSASSFQRSRPPSSIKGKYTMRSSMRDSLVEIPSRQQTRPISPPLSSPRSLSIRSLSPTGSFFGKKKVVTNHQPQYAQRTSASAPSTPKASRFSRLAKPNPAKAKAPAMSALKKSRFVDSDDDGDDDEPGLPVFRSRIADSDDEDDIPPISSDLRPVRGIPRRDDEGDSTELEDESDIGEPNSPPSLIKRSGGNSRSKPEAGASANGEKSLEDPRSSYKGGLVDSKCAADGEAPPKKSKRGFFGLGKRRESSTPRPSTSDGAAFTAHDDTVHAMESLARPSNDQRRHILLCNAEESWPLAAEEKEEEQAEAALARAMTADPSARKPKLSKRWSAAVAPMGKPSNSSQEQIVGAPEVAVGRSEKRKKFPGLRKAFGLKD